MLNWVLAILVYKDVLKESEAKQLAKDLAQAIHPTRYEDAYKQVSKILKNL